MNKGLKKTAVIGLSACLAFGSLTGCSKKNTFDASAAAAMVNGDEISAGLVKFASHYSQAQMEDIYKLYLGVEDPMGQDLYGNGSTMGDMVKEETMHTLLHLVSAEQHMSDYNVELTDDEKAEITAAAKQFISDNSEEVLEKMSATQEIVERYLTLRMIQQKMEPAMSADVDTEVSDEEAAQRKVQFVYFAAETESEEETELSSETETTAEEETETLETEAETAVLAEEETVKTQSAAETELTTEAESEAVAEEETETETEDPVLAAAMEEAYAKAAAMIADVQSGTDFEAAATAADADASVSTQTFGADSTSVASALITATEGIDDDTLVEAPIKSENGYYVAKVISKLDREATDEKKEDIVAQRKSDRISELYEEWESAGEVDEDADVLAKITFDFSLSQQTEAETEAETENSSEETVESEAGTEAVSEAAAEAETEAVTE